MERTDLEDYLHKNWGFSVPKHSRGSKLYCRGQRSECDLRAVCLRFRMKCGIVGKDLDAKLGLVTWFLHDLGGVGGGGMK